MGDTRGGAMASEHARDGTEGLGMRGSYHWVQEVSAKMMVWSRTNFASWFAGIARRSRRGRLELRVELELLVLLRNKIRHQVRKLREEELRRTEGMRRLGVSCTRRYLKITTAAVAALRG